MKLVYKDTNIITAEEPIIMHGCNCQGVMGSGVALAIRNRWPEAYVKYKDLHSSMLGSSLPLGSGQFVICEDKLGKKIIFNAFTQEFYGRNPNHKYCSYDAIENCLIMLRDYCQKNNILNIASSKIGCGLGGGDWDIVLILFNKIFGSTNSTIVIYDNPSLAVQSSRK